MQQKDNPKGNTDYSTHTKQARNEQHTTSVCSVAHYTVINKLTLRHKTDFTSF